MNSAFFVNIALFVLLLAAQILIFNNMNFLGYINPYPYILFIILYPVNSNKTGLLIAAFLLGIIMDMFCNSGGVHAAACLWMAAGRSFVLKFLEPKSGYSIDQKPNGYSLGIFWFFQYVSILMLIYFFFYFSLEIFTFVYLGEILIKTILSFVVSMFVISILQILLNPKN